MDAVGALAATVALLVVGGGVGTLLQNSHFNSLKRRERLYRRIPVLTFEHCPEHWQVERAGLVSGNVVVSLDYFRSFWVLARVVFDARIRAIEPLLERARREALLRMIEAARARGFDALVNVRLETARLANRAGGSREGLAGIEILAYGTGLKRVRPDP